jgi:hypothetical protein
MAVFLVVAVCALAWFLSRSTGHQHTTAHLLGFTNGVVGAIAPTFSTLTTNHASAFRQWLAAGTNAALFGITNRENCRIDIFPVCRFYTRETRPIDEETPLLNAPTFSGIRLMPGEGITAQVALLPHHGPWKVMFIYHRYGFLQGIGGIPNPGGSIESDWITP